MIESLDKEIEAINNNLSILPTQTKKNKLEYNKYIEEQISVYKIKMEELENELSNRYNEYLKKYTSDEEVIKNSDIDIDLIKITESNFDSIEKMNLNFYIYQLGHYYDGDLDKINEIIDVLIKKFNNVGIILTIKDFNYTEVVNKYMNCWFNSRQNIHTIFENLFWENPNLINQIELNFRSLYFKYKKQIDKFYSNQAKKDSLKCLNYPEEKEKIKKLQHSSVQYLAGLLIDKEILISEFSSKNIENLTNEFLLDKDNETNYYNLLKLEDSLIEYKGLTEFRYIIADLKKLYEKKNEYKGVYLNKYKEIAKKEKELFKFNKKINSRFSSKNIGEVKLKRNECITDLYSLYKELDELKIQDQIFNLVNDDTTYLELLKLCTYNFSYFVKLLKERNSNLELQDIKENIIELFTYVYDNEFNIINNIRIMEEKNIPQIISDRYRLVNIDIQDTNISEDAVDNCIDKIKILIMNFDLIASNINVEEIKFILKIKKIRE